MSLFDLKSLVSFVDRFESNRCLQFGFVDAEGRTHRAVVGQDVLTMGLKNWERPINATPGSPIWRALFYAPLVLSGRKRYNVVFSYPHSMKAAFTEVDLRGSHKLIIPDDNGGEVHKTISIDECIAVPEAYAHAYAYRDMLKRECVVISIGFGTLELGMVDRTSKIYEPRLASHRYGLHKVAKPFRDRLVQMQFDDSDIRQSNQEHFFDDILARVYDENEGRDIKNKVNLVVRGGSLRAPDLKDASEAVLRDYAAEVCKHIADYVEAQRYTGEIDFVITGGGVNYSLLVEAVRNLLARYGFANVTIATKTQAKFSAAVGLSSICSRLFEGDSSALGIDVGNNSVIFESSTEAPQFDVEIPRDMISLQ